MQVRPFMWVVTVSLLCGGGCAPPPRETVVGTWEGTVSAADETAVPLTLEFNAEGRVTMRAAGRSVAGTYSLTWGNILRIDTERPIAGKTSHQSNFTIEGERMLLKDPDGATAQLTRLP